ncbi:MAG TPA: ABC transporter ATP-binding protein [Anaerolineae bacterium]|nr:ABC transporter ATP-binding protein [Anaerolineae bacterium]HPL29741.1 ABC transporter ATP-binding protein [Anaerolineae bacterium]
MTQLAIRTDGLSRDFGAVKAVDGLSLEVASGTVFGFLGPNGSGKTTTIRLLLGLLEPTRGRAEVLGYDTLAQGDEVRARTGALLEHSGLYERLSAADNLEFYGRVWRLPPAERRARARELLEHMGLWARRGEQVGTWSRGMKQKLAVARALLHRPPLIFLDEPTAGLDPVASAALRDDLASLAAQEGVTVFLTTHNLAEAEKLCSSVGVIRQGRLLAVGSPDELRTRTSGPRAEVVGRGFGDEVLAALRARPEVIAAEVQNGHLVIELRGEVDMAALVSLLVGAGAQVEEVRRSKANLEEVFLTLMEEEK